MEQACGYTIYKVLCLETLLSDPGSKKATNLKDIATISLTHTENKANDIQTQFKNQVNTAQDGALKQALQSCSDSYSKVGEAFFSASFHLKYSDFNRCKARLTEATLNRQSCDEVFQGKPFTSPLSDSTTKVSQMQNNAEAIIYKLQPWFHVDMNKISNNQVGAQLSPCCPSF